MTAPGTRGNVQGLNTTVAHRHEPSPNPTTDVAQFAVLRLIEGRAALSQRELAASLGMSLGKANYCLRALIAKGFVKVQNGRNSRNKIAYLYLLTPSGMTRKAELTRLFLARKMREYETLREEIERLRHEADAARTLSTP